MLSTNSADFELTIRQQPERARVAGGKEKGRSSYLTVHRICQRKEGQTGLTSLAERKPVDPPPIVQLSVRDDSGYLAQ